jgi:AraC-type DNA-binding domain-containing proteins
MQETIEYVFQDLRLAIQTYAVHLRTVQSDWFYLSHQHPMFELNIVIEGEQICHAGGEEIIMTTGDMVLLKPELRHAFQASGDKQMSYCSIHFNMDEPHMRQVLCSIRGNFHSAQSPLALALWPVIYPITGKNELTRWETLSFFFQLFGAIAKLIDEAPDDLFGEQKEYDGLAFRLANRLNRMVEERLTMPEEYDDVTGISDICREWGYSMAYVNRIFKKVFGASPRQYLSMLKLREARLLLLNRQLSMDDITLRLGYKDIAQFSKQFKRWTNISPMQYRQMNR